MWGGWFGGYSPPSDYANAEVPNFNLNAFIISSVFFVPYLAFLVVMPGVRRKNIITLVVFTLFIFVGCTIALSFFYPAWAGGSQRIYAQFRAHSNERALAGIGVEIGLQKVNVTLKVEKRIHSSDYKHSVEATNLYYNEGFDITGVSSMSEALRAALYHGLPYPILTVLEYFSLNQDAFDWGRHYRVAGYYTHAALCFALSCWVLSFVLLLLVPHHFDKGVLATGFSCLVACLLYLLMSPCELRIAFTGEHHERVDLTVTFSWCFYLVFAVGLLCVGSGMALLLMQHYKVYTLSTFLDATIDDDVRPRKKRSPELLDVASSVEVMKRCRMTHGSADSDKNASSGFQSRNSSCSPSSASLRSQSSFETVRDEEELEGTPQFASPI
ncbi:unnamed protein product [Caenorhabditis auriculariae]|uniref:Dual oxidase maturation factor 1 n=1 Tax=Caenorhabditis auriculariae TaxID=2777116 RepID=A0A8S1GZK9_9PELO|nr:unnamed protein product [Caenorhabditis auriculariae]